MSELPRRAVITAMQASGSADVLFLTSSTSAVRWKKGGEQEARRAAQTFKVSHGATTLQPDRRCSCMHMHTGWNACTNAHLRTLHAAPLSDGSSDPHPRSDPLDKNDHPQARSGFRLPLWQD